LFIKHHKHINKKQRSAAQLLSLFWDVNYSFKGKSK
jgi:hypothetical protein